MSFLAEALHTGFWDDVAEFALVMDWDPATAC